MFRYWYTFSIISRSLLVVRKNKIAQHKQNVADTYYSDERQFVVSQEF